MYYGLKRAFPEVEVVSEERTDNEQYVPMPNLNIDVGLPYVARIYNCN